MTKARQRKRKRKVVQYAPDELDENVVRIVEALFLEMAKRSGSGLSTEDALKGSWSLFENGFLRIVASDDEHMSVEPYGGNRAERRAQAKKNRPLVEFKRQMDRAAFSHEDYSPTKRQSQSGRL